MEEEYELVPEKEVEDLKKDIDEIKKNPFGSSPSAKELVRAIKDLNDSVNHLIGLFRDAADAMKLEEKESEAIGKKLAPMLQKMDSLIDQNEKIARGIVGVADMVREDMSGKTEPQRPSFRISSPIEEQESAPMAPPSMAQQRMSQIAPAPDISPPPGMMQGMGGMPPPTAPKERPKRRIFGF